MGFFGRFFSKITTGLNGGVEEVITINISPEMCYKEMAINNAVSLIANAVCGVEWTTYRDNKKTNGDEYYKLNYSPNPNQTASQFWHKVICKMLNEGSALGFETSDGNLYVADSYSIVNQKDLKGHVYGNINVGSIMLRGVKTAEEVMIFNLEDEQIRSYIDSVYHEESKLIQSAADSFLKSKGTHYKFRVKGLKQGDTDFAKRYADSISKKIKKYLQSTNGVFVEYDGYELVQDNVSNGASVDDYHKLKDDIFKEVSLCFKIPLALMNGTSNDVRNVVKQFMTFGVKPYIKMIEQTIIKFNGYKDFSQGFRVKAKTNDIIYHDMIDDAPNLDKLISSGVQNIDEVRLAIGDDELGTEFSRTYWMTKNYDTAERVLKGGDSYG